MRSLESITSEQQQVALALKAAKDLAGKFALLPRSREVASALTKQEEAGMWLDAALKKLTQELNAVVLKQPQPEAESLPTVASDDPSPKRCSNPNCACQPIS